MDKFLLNFRMILSIIFLTISWISLFGIVVARNYWKKIFLLAIAYNCIIFFLIYKFYTKGVLEDLFPIISIIFFNFIFTFITGFGIVSNLIKNKQDLK
jgi:hypothetical protein